MKKLIVILILLSSNAHADWLFWKDKEEPKEMPEKTEKSVKLCHSAIRITNNDDGNIHYIFQHPCGEIIQVGIIDEIDSEIITINDLEIDGKTKYFNQYKKDGLVNHFFPNLSPLEIYRNN